VRIVFAWPTILLLTILSISFRTSFSSLASPLFFPQDVLVIQSSQINYTHILGISGNISLATSAYIHALLLAAAHVNYGVSVLSVSGLFSLSDRIHRMQLAYHPSQTQYGPLDQLTFYTITPCMEVTIPLPHQMSPSPDGMGYEVTLFAVTAKY
jgi:hypothetical protein